MTSRVVQILELRQHRCSERFGVGACAATGAPKCFQTYHTCGDRTAYNTNGEMRWYFHRQGDPVPYTADRPDDNTWYAPSMPLLQTVTTQPSRINIGALREGESALGLRGTLNITLEDFQFRNQVGDFYADEREVSGSFGALLLAWLGEAAPQLEAYLYTGVKGQALSEMTVRRFDVTNIDPPSNGKWTISGIDPLDRALRRKAKFPRETDVQLVTAVSTWENVLTVSGEEADIFDDFGNTATKYALIGEEIIGYTGYSGADGEWTLTGVTRGALNTTAAEHDAEDTFQRVGHFHNENYWKVVYYLLTEHTTIDASIIPYADWQREGDTWLNVYYARGTVIEPTPVEDLCGELMRDGQFSIWWDERAQEIKMMAVRQPNEDPRSLNETSHIVSSSVTRKPDERFTRIFVNYGRFSPIEDLDEFTNYRRRRGRVEGDKELDIYADGTIRTRTIYSRWMRSDANAEIAMARQVSRFSETPKYISATLSAKDGDLGIGDVIAVESENHIDTLGNPLVEFWQVIEWEEVAPNETYRILGQSYRVIERPAFIMADDAPNFAGATDEEKKRACYISNDDGTMPDGSPAYLIQ